MHCLIIQFRIFLFPRVFIFAFPVKAFGIHALMTGILLVLTSLFTHLGKSSSSLDEWLHTRIGSSWVARIFCFPEMSLVNSNRSSLKSQDDIKNAATTEDLKTPLTILLLDRITLIAYVIISLKL